MKKKETKVGIGFATGRKSFQNVLRTNIHSWSESGIVEDKMISLNIFIAYDLTYQKTIITDYTNIAPGLVEQIDSFTMIGNHSIEEETEYLIKGNVLTRREAQMIFNKGYAGQRNAILYNAIKHKMNYLIFMDDDEYPLAVTHNNKTAIWSGQDILSTHLGYIKGADVTHGHHCGYISPVPYMEFNDDMTESDFRMFIEAISNDILNWDSLKSIMNNGGVTYADTDILKTDDAVEVEEMNKAKFISGGNLCINLTDPLRVFPFYNPPGARGEDTFLSVCFSERKVLRVPCYTFHDGFSKYNYLLDGVLPRKLKFIRGDNSQIIDRFYKACLGWIRYKPLLLYLTQPESYDQKIEEMRRKITEVLPKINTYFQGPDFNIVLRELEEYNKNVEKHYKSFKETQLVWSKIMNHFANRK
ncbi:hypothetical protein [Parasporobacterium paucivorans]|uniref:Glycosyl transferase family 2 n=1 Tax=Parasporobacterium paucivorans DSM 15970 TaxID=1122934 RepID=A0A1M6EJN8_9FIRM|nr:hypothetical protein [Parasporobacterium paucivorans]SHI85732.1 hypothetical protein SAMN02745691_00929 [Parasporobacterium paucivorans DSM 15970]